MISLRQRLHHRHNTTCSSPLTTTRHDNTIPESNLKPGKEEMSDLEFPEVAVKCPSEAAVGGRGLVRNRRRSYEIGVLIFTDVGFVFDLQQYALALFNEITGATSGALRPTRCSRAD